MKWVIRFVVHGIIVIILTLLSQLGGIIWLINLLLFHFYKRKVNKVFRFISFIILYLIATFIVVPPIAKQFGRIPLNRTYSKTIIPHHYSTVILNRNYVSPSLSKALDEVTMQIAKQYPDMKISYLDACFPFIDRFPLLPHLSHHDGKKVDLSFMYKKNGISNNRKPAWLGYGVFEGPKKGESNSIISCKAKNNMYDFSKYLSFGGKTGFELDDKRTKVLVELLVSHKACHKLFIEPHLKTRMQLNHSKIRFQGCHSVRHDDHIHFQVK